MPLRPFRPDDLVLPVDVHTLATHDLAVTRHAKPAGVLLGFDSEDAWFEYRLENHQEFLRRVSASRAAVAAGRGVRLEDA